MTKRDFSHLPYRRGVGIMLLNDRDEVFVAQRIDMPSSAWQMPQGGIDEGEDPAAAAWREMAEEIGTDKAELLAESRDWHRYDLPPDLVPRLWKGRYRGQEQKLVRLPLCRHDDDIDIETENPEFSAWRWASLTELPSIIVPFKRPLYMQLVEEFQPVVSKLGSAKG